MNDKANPNVALTEANAFEQWQAVGMAPNYVPFLSKDVYGQEIVEPDLSNPTRSRHERPLDTIRSFEAAAYGKEYTIGSGDSGSELGTLNRGDSRQSIAYETRRSVNRNSSTSGLSHTQRNYLFGNMQEQYADDGSLESQAGHSSGRIGASSTPRALFEPSQQPSASSWDNRQNQGYGSPVSESGRTQFITPQKLNYTTPATPPQENKTVEKKKKSWGKRLSFGKNKA